MGGDPDQRRSARDQRPAPDDNSWGKAGLAVLIPSVLAAGPLAGVALGWLVRRLTGWGEWVVLVCVFLGLAAGVRETIRIIRRLS